MPSSITWSSTATTSPAAGSSRRPDAYQRTALDWTTPTCSVVGCDQPRREIDHRDDWARTHHTVLHELDPYCKFHHYLKGHKGLPARDRAPVAGGSCRPIPIRLGLRDAVPGPWVSAACADGRALAST